MRAPGARMGTLLVRTLAVSLALGMALFGSFLLAVTPSLDDRPGLQILWVIASLVLLKVPLLYLVWWLIARRRSRPDHAWSDEAAGAFLERAEAELARAEQAPDAAARLTGLHAEVWAAVDRAGDRSTPALVDLALRIDRLRLAAGTGPTPAPLLGPPRPGAARP